MEQQLHGGGGGGGEPMGCDKGPECCIVLHTGEDGFAQKQFCHDTAH